MLETPSMASHIVTGLPASVPKPGPRTRDEDSGFWKAIAETPFAGYLMFRWDIEPVLATDNPRRLLESSPGAFIAVDEEGGLVSQLSPQQYETALSARVLGRGASPEEVRAIATRLATDIRSRGLNLDFAPVCDVDLEPTNPVIGPRSFSGDPEVVSELASAFAAGLMDGGVLACAKHFPGHGDTQLDSHLDLPVCRATREELSTVHLAPFRRAIADGIPMIMVSHVAYPLLAPERVPATLSPEIVTGLLREELGFKGVIITDAMEMKAVASNFPPGEAAVRAMEAGVDLLCYGHYNDGVPEAVSALDEAARSGRLAKDRLHASRERIAALERELERLQGQGPVEPPVVDLHAICRRALRWVGPERKLAPSVARSSRWLVVEPHWDRGKSLSILLEELGFTVNRAPWQELGELNLAEVDAVIVASCQRDKPSPQESTALAEVVAKRPTWLVAFAQDDFLQDFSGAAGRISAADPGPTMRAVVAETLFGRI